MSQTKPRSSKICSDAVKKQTAKVFQANLSRKGKAPAGADSRESSDGEWCPCSPA